MTPASATGADRMRRLTVLLTIALIVLGVAWETVLAPLRPGGSLLALKVLPLLLVLPAFWKGRIRHYQLWSMLILAYLCEGVVRGMSEEAIGIAKLAAHWLAFGPPLMIATLPAAALLGLDGAGHPSPFP